MRHSRESDPKFGFNIEFSNFENLYVEYYHNKITIIQLYALSVEPKSPLVEGHYIKSKTYLKIKFSDLANL